MAYGDAVDEAVTRSVNEVTLPEVHGDEMLFFTTRSTTVAF